MSTYTISQLLGLWAQEKLTVEQVIGHLLQQIMALEKRISELERRRE